MHSSIHSVFIKCFSKVFIYLKGREREGFPCHGSLPKCHDKRVRPGWSQESGIPSQIFFLESKRPEDLASSPASQGCVLAGSWTGNRAAKSYTCTLKSRGIWSVWSGILQHQQCLRQFSSGLYLHGVCILMMEKGYINIYTYIYLDLFRSSYTYWYMLSV